MKPRSPQVGTGVIIIKNGKILLAKRKGSHGAGMWGGAGGHVEFGETPIDAARREVLEEWGISVKNITFLCCSNFLIDEKHYIDIGFTADIAKGIPKIQPDEVHRIEEIKWFDIANMPKPLFPIINNYLKALKTKQRYFNTA